MLLRAPLVRQPSSSGADERKDCLPRVLRVPSEPGAASIERDHADVAGLYPVTRRRYVGRLRLDHETSATHEPNGIEYYLGVEVELRVVGNLAEERQGNQRLYRRVEQLTASVARARDAGNRVLP
jgi:hypothetical protein